MPEIRFFATRSDLLPLLEPVEKVCELKYTKYGASDAETPVTFDGIGAIPNLGVASHESAINCTTYLVCQKGDTVRPRLVSGRYLFDQVLNPDTVTFAPGGLWAGEILLHGRFATASTGPFSSELMKRLGSTVRKRFEKIKAFYIGPESARMLDSGRRLTIAAQSPQSFDLVRV